MFLVPYNPCLARPDYHAGIETGFKGWRGFKGWPLEVLPGGFVWQFCPAVLPGG